MLRLSFWLVLMLKNMPKPKELDLCDNNPKIQETIKEQKYTGCLGKILLTHIL